MQSAQKNGCKTHPDGGWGWCVVAAAFVTQFIVVGLQNSSGVIFNELVQKFNKPRGETGFVSSISVGMMFLLGPFTTSLCQRFTCRRVSILGGFLCILGMIASAYASTLELMYISFGVVWGLGTSFCYFPAMIVLVPYFDKRLPLVTGIVSSGSGFGTLVLSPFIQWFSHQYGVKNAFLMLAGLHGLVFFAGFVYKPVAKKYKLRQKNINQVNIDDENKTSTSRSNNSHTEENSYLTPTNNTKQKKKRNCWNSNVLLLLKNKSYLAWCFGLSVFILGYFVPFVHLVRYAVLIGIPEVKSAFLISTLSISSTIFKLVSGKLAGLKCVSKMQIYQFGLLTMGIGTTLIPISHSFYGLMVYCIVYGFGESVFIVMIPLITKDIVGVKMLPLALGCVFMIMGVPTTVGAPIAGWIYDYFNDYSYAFFVAGCMNVLGVLIMFLIDYFGKNNFNEVILENHTKRWLKTHRENFKQPDTMITEPVMTNHKYSEPMRSIYFKDADTNDFEHKPNIQSKEHNSNKLDDVRYFLNLSDSKKSIVVNQTNYRNLLKRKSESITTSYTAYSTLTLKEDSFNEKMFSEQLKRNIPRIIISCSSSKSSINTIFNSENDHTQSKTPIILDYYDHSKAVSKINNNEEILLVESIMTAV